MGRELRPEWRFVAIANATGSTYQVQESDEGFQIEVVATATNDNGVAISATSVATSAVLDAAPTITTPTIAGIAEEGDTLTASASSGQSDNAVTYQWEENSGPNGSFVAIANATGSTYQVQESDEGFQIEVVATATNDNGVSISATSTATAAVLDAAPTITTPAIAGAAEEGDTLTASASSGQSDNAVTYQWEENSGPNGSFVAIANATGSTYQVQESDEGFAIEVIATATNDNGVTTSATSAATAAVPLGAVTDEWLNTAGGTWTDTVNAPTNWSDGALPRSIDTALIDQAGSGAYTVTIPNAAAATAAVLTINSSSAIVSDQGTLTLSGALTIDAGTFKISGSGALSGETSISNAGALETVSGATLQVAVDVANFGAIETFATLAFSSETVTNTGAGAITVETSGSILDLELATVSGGIITDTVNGTINVSGTSTLEDGATVKGGSLADSGTLDISGTVMVESGLTVTGGSLSIASGATLDIENAATGTGATLDNVSVTNSGTLQVDGGTGGTTTVTLVLDHGTSITGGALLIHVPGSTVEGTVEIETGGAVLDDVMVTNNNTLTVDTSVTLTLDGGTVISGNTITDNGTIDVTGAATINGSANLTGGQVTVESGQTLTLDGATLTNTTVNDIGTVNIDAHDTLTLAGASGVTIDGSTSSNGTIDNAGTVALGSSTLTLLSGGFLTLDDGGKLTLSGGTISGTGGATLENAGNTISGFGAIGIGSPNTLNLINDSGATIEALGGTLTVKINSAVSNAGTLEAATGATLKITVGAIDNTGNIQVDGTLAADQPTANGGHLTLNDGGTVTLASGTIKSDVSGNQLNNDGNAISGSGQIGDGTDTNLTLNNNSGSVEASGGTLTLDTRNTVVNAASLEAASGGTLVIDDAVTNQSGADITTFGGGHITLNGVTIGNSGTIVLDAGSLGSFTTMLVEGTVTLNGAGSVTLATDSQIVSNMHAVTLDNAGNDISGAGLIGDAFITFDNEFGATVDATGFLSLAAATTDNSGMLEATGGGTLQIEGSVTNSGTVEADGGTIDVFSTATISGDAVVAAGGGLVDFAGSAATNVSFSGSGTLQVGQPLSFTGTISSFGTGDAIDLPGVAFQSGEYAVWTQTSTTNGGSGTLQLFNGPTPEGTFNLAGSYSQSSFALTTDFATGTEIVASPTTVGISGVNGGGDALANQAVTISLGATDLGTVAYQWLLDGQAVSGAIGTSFTPNFAEVGETLTVVATFADPTSGHQDVVTGVAGTIQVNPNDDWVNSSGGDFAAADNWDEGVPTAVMTALIDASGTYTVTSSADATVAGLSATETATLDISAGTFTVTDFSGGGPLILSGGTFDIGNSTTSVASLTQPGGTLTGTGTLTVTGAANLAVTNFSLETGSGETVLQGSSTTSGNFDLDGGRELQNQGTLTVDSGGINLGYNPFGTSLGGGTIDNASGATIQIESDAGIAGVNGTTLFSNEGLVTKSVTTGTTTIGVVFDNSGTVDVATGTLDLSAGGTDVGATYEGAGAIEFGGGTHTLDDASSIGQTNVVFGGGTTTLNGASYDALSTAISGGTADLSAAALTSLGGDLNISGGALDLGAATETVATFEETGGTLSGSGTLTVTGAANLAVTNFSLETGSGETVLQGSSTTSGNFDLDGGRELQNQGTLTVDFGGINLGYNPFGTSLGGGTIDNASGATIQIESDAGIAGVNGTTLFSNEGLVTKSVTTGTTTIGVDVRQ